MKQVLRRWCLPVMLCLTMVLSLSMTIVNVNASATNSAIENGLEAVLVTSKSEYQANEKVDVAVKLTNVGNKIIEHVESVVYIPDNMKLESGNPIQGEFDLRDGSKTTETVFLSLEEDAVEKPEGPDNTTTKPGETEGGTNSSTAKPEGNSKPDTGDKSTLVVWIILLIVSAGGMVVWTIKNKKGRKANVLSILVGVLVIGSFMSATTFAAIGRENISVSTNVKVGGQKVTIRADVSYYKTAKDFLKEGWVRSDPFEDVWFDDNEQDVVNPYAYEGRMTSTFNTTANGSIAGVTVQNFSMLEGATLYQDAQMTHRAGLQFQAVLDKATYESLEATGKDISYGMLIVPVDYVIDGYNLTETNVFKGVKYYSTDDTFEVKELAEALDKRLTLCIEDDTLEKTDSNGDYLIQASLVDIIDDNLVRAFVGIGYIRFEDGSNESIVTADYYDGAWENNARSMTYTVQLALENNSIDADKVNAFTKEYVKHETVQAKNYRYFVRHHLTSDEGEEVETETYYGKIGSNVIAQAKTYPTHIVDMDRTRNLASTLYANGKTVIDIYYKENIVEVTDVQEIGLSTYRKENNTFVVSKAENITVDLSGYTNLIQGEPVSVVNETWGNPIAMDSTSTATNVVLSAADFGANLGAQTLSIYFEQTEDGEVIKYTKVSVDIFLCTYVLRTAEDIDAFGALAKAESTEAGVWDGYFVLGNDIIYNKEFTPFITRETVNKATAGVGSTPWANWVDVTKYGFKGVFDGQGHAIEGLKIVMNATWSDNAGEPNAAGFIGLLHNNGVIRNVAFTKAEFTGAGNQGGGLISYASNGVMENIYVSYKKLANTGTGRVGTFIGMDSRAAARVKNCFVDVVNAEITGANVFAIGHVHEGYGVVNNVYVVGAENVISIASTQQNGTNNIYGAYNTYVELLAANHDYASFVAENNTFWRLVNRLPYPKLLALPTLANRTIVGGDIATGTEIPYDLGQYEMLALDARGIAAGITINGNRVVVPSGIADKTKFSVVVQSVYDKDTVIATTEYTAITSRHIDVAELIHVETSRGSDIVSIDLTNYLGAETLTGTLTLKNGTTPIAGAMISNNKITFAKSSLTAFGQHVLTATITDAQGFVTTVNAKVYRSTMAIKTVADLDEFGAVAKAQNPAVAVWDGYFVLANDLAYNKQFTPFITRETVNKATAGVGNTPWANWVDVVNYGFKGVFDGLGHTIEGLEIVADATWSDNAGEPNAAGFIGLLNNTGVIRNVAFTDAKFTGTGSQGGGLIAYASNGTMENIYVSYAKLANTGTGNVGTFIGIDSRAGARVKNCYVDLTNAMVSGSNVWAIGRVHEGYGVVNRVYVTGLTSAIQNLSSVSGEANLYGAYATRAEMEGANIAITAANGWDMNCWTTDGDGLPIFK